jgi:hypothetical protein
VDIDGSIDALIDALAVAGIERPLGLSNRGVIDEIEATIAPLRIPADLLRFWERVGGSPRRVQAWPEFCPPEFGLDSWRNGREEFPGQAPALFYLIAYSSWNCMSIELAGPHGEGGSLFQWSLDGEDFILRYHRLGDWLERIAGLTLAGSYKRWESGEKGAWLEVEDDRAEKHAARFDELPPHPVYGRATVFPKEVEAWPVHWQQASGVEPEDIPQRGATHTITELLASDPAHAISATVEGKVISLAGQRDTYVRVTDGTETIDIHCPAAITALGPRLGERYEFDVVVPPGHRRRPPENVIRAKHPDDAVEALTERLSSIYPGGVVAVTASAIRPCQPRAK